jgi:membrane protein implicated in regulation of membrane protease activity
MAEWWSNIPAFERIFWYFALPFTVVLILQLILTFIGLEWHDGGFEASHGLDAGHETDFQAGFRLFTLRNFIIFFTGFGWAGLFAIHAGFGQTVTILFAFFAGLFLMFAVAGMFYLMTRLTQSGNINLSNAAHSSGRVYLPIPGNRSGMGQVQITVQGAIREVDAMTDGEPLPTGTPIQVTEVLNEEVLIVKKN